MNVVTRIDLVLDVYRQSSPHNKIKDETNGRNPKGKEYKTIC